MAAEADTRTGASVAARMPAEADRQRLERRERELERQREELKRRLDDARAEALEAFDRELEGYRQAVRGIIRELQKAPSLTAAETCVAPVRGASTRSVRSDDS